MGSVHTSIENLVQPNSDNNIQIKYPDNMFGSAEQSNEHKMTSQHNEHHTEMSR